MNLDWGVLDKLLLAEAETSDVNLECKEQISEFVKTHDFNTFSEDSLKQLAGIWDLSMGPTYEFQTNSKVPNIFSRVGL